MTTAGGSGARGVQRRVLLVAPEPFYEDRGTPIAVRQVLEALSELGYRVELLTFPMGQPLELPGLAIHRAANPFGIGHVPVGFSARKLLLDASLVLQLRSRIATGDWYAVHAVEEAAFPAAVLAGQAGLPLIYDMQSSLPEQLRSHPLLGLAPVQRLLRRCERWLLTRADVVACSKGLESHVRRVAPEARVREWHFAAEPAPVLAADVAALRGQLKIPAGASVVLYSGTMEPYQGLPELLAAMPQVLQAHPATVFVLVGIDPADSGELRPRTVELIERGVLRLVPRQPRNRMPRYLGMADILVSSRAYGSNLPLKIFDYLAAGRPIVATDIETHRAVLSSQTAELATPGADGLADAINALLADPARAARLAAAAAEYADTHLGWDTFVGSVAALYDGLAAGRRD